MKSFALTPPAGLPITEVSGRQLGLEQLFPGWHFVLLSSGTASLATALRLAFVNSRLNCGDVPEVIIPAYCCPSLVSACRFVGARPVICDLQAGSSRLDLDQLKELITPRTVALIATAFCGIPEAVEAVRQHLPEHVSLVEDNAQRLVHYPADEAVSDFVVLSFGRGKPASLLGGGALLCKRVGDARRAAKMLSGGKRDHGALQYLSKRWLYNRLRQPEWFGLLSQLPGTSLGQTRYRPLSEIRRMDLARSVWLPDILAEAFSPERRRLNHVWDPAFSDSSAVVNLAAEFLDDGPVGRLPILMPSSESAGMVTAIMRDAGVGSTRMYGEVLPIIDGVGEVRASSVKNAVDFAQRVITLPIVPEIAEIQVRQLKAAIDFGPKSGI